MKVIQQLVVFVLCFLVYNAVFASEETNNLVVVSVEPLSSDEDAIYVDQLITETDQEASESNSAVDLVQGNTSDVPEVLTRKRLHVLDKTRPCIKIEFGRMIRVCS